MSDLHPVVEAHLSFFTSWLAWAQYKALVFILDGDVKNDPIPVKALLFQAYLRECGQRIAK